MCLQCLTDPYYYGEVFPGWSLMRARRQYFTEMKIKEWGLIECNDPTFYFMTTPQLLEDEDKEWILARNFSEELSGSLSECKRLVDSFVTTPEVEDYCEKREYRSIEEKLCNG